MSLYVNVSFRRTILQLLSNAQHHQRKFGIRPLSVGAKRRNPAAVRARKRQEKKKQLQTNENLVEPTKAEPIREATLASTVTAATADASSSAAAAAAAAAPTPTSNASILQFIQKYILPVRYRTSNNFYTHQHALAAIWRFPLWLLLAAVVTFEQTNPYGCIRITGPSMLPTLAPDGSDIYFKSAWHKTIYYRVLQYLFPSLLQPSYTVGDLVGLSHPHHPHHVSCKRVVGVAGDEVQRYGEYVHLFEEQDPVHWGITWPPISEQVHSWMDRSCAWDAACNNDEAAAMTRDPRRKIVVPDGTVWVEGDCPGLAIDSRQYGPVPLDWIQGKIIGRLWPFWRKQNELSKRVRPHPISLDDETLRIYNVNRISATVATMKANAQT